MSIGSRRADSVSHPDEADRLFQQGLQALRAQDPLTAKRLAHAALQADPRHAGSYALMGVARATCSDHAEALPWLLHAVQLAPRQAQYHYNLGAVHDALAQWPAAMRSYRRTLALQPGHVQARSNLADLLRRHGRLAEALAHFETLQRTAPDAPGLPFKLALTYQALKRDDLAEPLFRQALHTDAEHDLVQWGYAHLLLLKKRFAPGWAAYEHRSACARFNGVHHFPHRQPLWGGEPLHGKTVLIHREQGLGDEIMFGSLIAAATADAARVLVVAAPALVRLWQHTLGTQNRPTDRVQVGPDWGAQPPLWDQPPPPAWLAQYPVDYQCPMGRLAYLTRPTLASFGTPQASLAVPDELVRHWCEVMDAALPSTSLRRPPRVGVMWAAHPSTHSFDGARRAQRKNMPLPHWLPLAQHFPNVQLISLANTEHAAQITSVPGLRLADFSGQLHDLADTAALMKNLDLVITIDTSVAHLAGALGLPVWVLLCWDADWRWGEHDCHSHWYPQMRLLRQHSAGDWAPVVQTLVEDLRAWVQSH